MTKMCYSDVSGTTNSHDLNVIIYKEETMLAVPVMLV